MFRSFLQKLVSKNRGQISYSQCGEDVIVRFVFNSLNIARPSYIDIGAHHPFYLNNTAILYANGSRGINIEPNKAMLKSFKQHRPKDINLNFCVGKEDGFIDYYIMDISTLNTASKDEAIRLEANTERRIIDVVQVPVKNINRIIDEYSNGIFPHFLTLDVEGFDEVILKSIDFEKTSPQIICVETLTYTEFTVSEKKDSLILYLKSKNYSIYADTYINTLLVRNDVWKKSNL
ncbi:methyltransferase, FkbM family [Desulfomicrobium norvegicum]|uniref:Methyltransferase, FkbM family n=2 Tax=Desulfomicrobium norvegicum (strain DSM 1741 / NCIMB 8310) TaxID=52561 RepID=A0A8G2C1A2_DESNO|nr:methyltransferase, FkbM family [Desulfomicrobium norvegicum]